MTKINVLHCLPVLQRLGKISFFVKNFWVTAWGTPHPMGEGISFSKLIRRRNLLDTVSPIVVWLSDQKRSD